MISKIVLRNLKRNYMVKILNIIVLIVCFFSISIIDLTLSDINFANDYEAISAFGNIGLKLSDSFNENDTLSIFFSDVNRLNDLKLFVTELFNSEEFDYCLTYENPLGIVDTNSISNKLYAYGDKSLFELNNEQYVTVNALQVTGNVASYFPINISSGRNFVNNDFKSNDNNINILMGSNYKEYYELGQMVKLEYWGKFYQATIVGFLEKESYIIKSGATKILDNYIIVPFIFSTQKPLKEDDIIFQGITYTCAVNGIAFPRAGYNSSNTIKRINELCRIYDISLFGYEGMNSNAINFYNYIMQLGIKNVYFYKIIILITSLISFLIIQIFIINSNFSSYNVHILSGASIHLIYLYAMIEIIIDILISFSLSVFIFSISIGALYVSKAVVTIAICMLICAFIVTIYTFSEKNKYKQIG